MGDRPSPLGDGARLAFRYERLLAPLRESQPQDEAARAMAKLLDDGDSGVRDPAAQALAGTGAAAAPALSDLITALGRNRMYFTLVHTASRAIAGIPGGPEKAVPALLKALADDDSGVEDSAAKALSEIAPREPGVVQALGQALSARSSNACHGAAQAPVNPLCAEEGQEESTSGYHPVFVFQRLFYSSDGFLCTPAGQRAYGHLSPLASTRRSRRRPATAWRLGRRPSRSLSMAGTSPSVGLTSGSAATRS